MLLFILQSKKYILILSEYLLLSLYKFSTFFSVFREYQKNLYLSYKKNLSDSFLISSLLLTSSKLVFLAEINWFENILLLLFLMVFSYKFEIYEKVENIISKILQKTLAPKNLCFRNETCDGFIGLHDGNKEEVEKWKNLKNTSFFYHKFSLSTFMFLIWLRLVLLSEPIIISCIYMSIIIILMLNKFIIIAQIISLIVTISKVCYALNMVSEKVHESALRMFTLENKSKERSIKPNYSNTIIISYIIISTLNKLSYENYKIVKKESKELKKDANCDYVTPVFVDILVEEHYIEKGLKYDPYNAITHREVKVRIEKFFTKKSVIPGLGILENLNPAMRELNKINRCSRMSALPIKKEKIHAISFKEFNEINEIIEGHPGFFWIEQISKSKVKIHVMLESTIYGTNNMLVGKQPMLNGRYGICVQKFTKVLDTADFEEFTLLKVFLNNLNLEQKPGHIFEENVISCEVSLDKIENAAKNQAAIIKSIWAPNHYNVSELTDSVTENLNIAKMHSILASNEPNGLELYKPLAEIHEKLSYALNISKRARQQNALVLGEIKNVISMFSE